MLLIKKDDSNVSLKKILGQRNVTNGLQAVRNGNTNSNYISLVNKLFTLL